MLQDVFVFAMMKIGIRSIVAETTTIFCPFRPRLHLPNGSLLSTWHLLFV